MLDPKDFKDIPDWMLGGYWGDIDFKDTEGKSIDTKKFGSNEFHGRTHPAIAYMAIMRFTEPGDVVYIPFAGSGTEVDVCKEYNREFVAIDLNPTRPDIIEDDATMFCLHGKAKLVIAHPPYEDVVDYGQQKTNLSQRGKTYEGLTAYCVDNFYESLEKGGKLVVIVGSVYRDGQEIPLDMIWYKYAIQNDMKMIGRIVRDFGETKAKGKNKNLWKYRLIKFKRFYLKLSLIHI